MVKEYKELYITDEPDLAMQAKTEGKYVVLALPLRSLSEDEIKMQDSPKDTGNGGMEFCSSDFPYALEDIEHVETAYLDKLLCRLKGLACEILRTERCTVREITEADVDKLYEIYSRPSITEYMEDLYKDRDEELAYTRDYIKYQYGFYDFGMWIVEDSSSGCIIGRAGFDMREGYEIPELGYMIREDFQRQGRAYEVCTALLSYGRKELGFDRVGAFSVRENTASTKLLEKLGFHYIDSTCLTDMSGKGQRNQRYDYYTVVL